jgi:transcriptional regulator with XRE-family HTH domain
MRPLAPELEAKIDEVNGWLFYGDGKEVARRARVQKSRVSEVLNKKRTPSKKILDAAIEIMNENKARFEITPKMKIA